MNRTTMTILLLAVALVQAGCAQVMGRLRPDFDDGYASEEQATAGGLLADFSGAPDERYSRDPASQYSDAPETTGREPNLRDRVRDSFRSEEAAMDEEQAEARGPTPLREDLRHQAARRMTRGDFVDGAEDAGSLWSSNGESNFFFSKNKTRTAGELVTINIEGDFLRDIAAEVKRTLRRDERDYEVSQLRAPAAKAPAGATAPNADQVAQSSAAPDQDARMAYAQVDLQGAIGVKGGDPFLAEVVERYPNGNYKIRGTKRIPYRGTSRLMTLVGVVRGSDLSDDDKVNSGKLYEYRLEVVR